MTNEMRARFISGRQIAAELSRLIRQHDQLFWAVAWGSDNHDAANELHRYKSKIRRLIIGTHFYQTDPAFLEHFKNAHNVRVSPASGTGVFHPKLYLFLSADRAAAIVGSANFTNAAFTANVETCALFEGTPTEPLFSEMREFVETECWPNADQIDDDFLRAYRIQHEATRRARQSLMRFVKLRQPRGRTRDDILEMDWSAFITLVQDRGGESIEGRVKALQTARILFEQKMRFADFEQNERKAIAGTLGKREPALGLDSDQWGWFGSMFGFGPLRTLINANSRAISDALDCIPLTGLVVESDYRDFVRNLLRAFRGQDRQPRIAPASRFLAMKRPDYFVCVDQPNRRRLSAALGLAASALDLGSYWSDLIEPITFSPWWRSPRPRGPQGPIWDGRAAFLDALYYEPA